MMSLLLKLSVGFLYIIVRWEFEEWIEILIWMEFNGLVGLLEGNGGKMVD